MEEKIRLAVFGQKRLSREGGIEIVVKELCTRMAQNGCDVTCYNRAGHHVSGAEYDKTIEYDGIRQKVVPTIEKKGLVRPAVGLFAFVHKKIDLKKMFMILTILASVAEEESHSKYPCRRSCLFLLDTKTFWQACNLHYSRFGLGPRKMEIWSWIQIYPTG